MGKAGLNEVLGRGVFCRQAGAGAMLGSVRSAELQGVCLPGTEGKGAFANPNPSLNPTLPLDLSLNLSLALSLGYSPSHMDGSTLAPAGPGAEDGPGQG